MGQRGFLEKWHLGPQSWTIKEDVLPFFVGKIVVVFFEKWPERFVGRVYSLWELP